MTADLVQYPEFINYFNTYNPSHVFGLHESISLRCFW